MGKKKKKVKDAPIGGSMCTSQGETAKEKS
jgi:hypothetical protein